MHFKKYILFLVICLIFVGCNSKNSNTIGNKPNLSNSEFSSPYPSNLGVKESDEEDSYITKLVFDVNEYANVSDWETFLKNKYGINIKISYVNTANKKNINYDNIKGLVYINNGEDFLNLILAQKLQPLNNYIECTDRINKDYLDLFTYDSKIYGIPASNDISIYSRMFYREYLELFSIDVIDTIDEFYSFLECVTYNDDGGNIIGNGPALRTSLNNMTMELSDIQKAFGCYFNREKSLISSINGDGDGVSIAYNPNTSSFEDAVYSEGILDYLYFIKSMSDSGMMDTSETISNEQYIRMDNSKPLATFIGNETSYLNSNEYIVGSRYLTGTNSSNLNEFYIDLTCYGISMDVNNPEAYLKLLFEKVASESELVLSFAHGVPGLDYILFDDYWINWKDKKLPGFVVPTDFIYVEYGTDPPSNIDLEEHRKMRTLYTQQKEDYIKNLDFNKLYGLPVFCSDSFINNSSAFINGQNVDFNKYILYPIFNEGVSIIDAIDNYKKQFHLNGTKYAIERINELIGEKTAYSYD